MIEVSVLRDEPWPDNIGWGELAQSAVSAAVSATSYANLTTVDLLIEVAVKLSDNDDVQSLNRDYRGKDKPTNVLSFPQSAPDLLSSISASISGGAAGDDGEAILGDMILAWGVCSDEAKEKGIDLQEHVTHLIVHGTLHLLGYDHIEDVEASDMETLETQILAGFGIANPYGDRD